MEAIEGQSETPVEDLPPIKPLDKAIVAFAGPLFSFLLALTLGTVVWVVGKPASQADKTTVIGIVKKDGPADLLNSPDACRSEPSLLDGPLGRLLKHDRSYSAFKDGIHRTLTSAPTPSLLQFGGFAG